MISGIIDCTLLPGDRLHEDEQHSLLYLHIMVARQSV